MNLGEKIYCPHCLRELPEEQVCPWCGCGPEQPPLPYALDEGTLLQKGRYELAGVLGQGGFGLVYTAWDLVLDMPVVIKEYFPAGYCTRDAAESDQVEVLPDKAQYYQFGLQTFLREAHILASLQNIPTVVKVFDCFEKNGTAYIVMELVRGEPLDVFYRKAKLTPDKLLKMLRPTVDDLTAIHNLGVLHRDITPQNLLVQADGTVKLIDFGAATALTEDSSRGSAWTPNFAAPEQFDENGRIGTWVDVYGLAATLYAVIVGSPLQDAPARLRHDALRNARPAKLHIPRRLFRTLCNALVLDPEQRTQTMEDFRADLYHLPRPRTPRTPRQKALLVLYSIVLVLCVSGVQYGIIKMVTEDLLFQWGDAAQCYLKQDTDKALYLAENYRQGREGDAGYPRSISKSLYWYKWAADKGDPYAMCEYAFILEQGILTQRDLPNAIKYFEKAAEADVGAAWNELGTFYYTGNEVEASLEKALFCFQKAEEQEYPLAFCNLGILYERGEGVEKNPEKALEYYQKAARLCPEGIYCLAICYKDGVGVEKSDPEYIQYLYEAAAQGSPAAMCEIGWIYETGYLEQIDYDMAFEWYMKAVDLEYPKAYYLVAHLYRDVFPQDRNNEENASYFMKKALERGYKPD